ncbi:MAG: family 16 glycosylhydrolase [Acutalibacteraceae bacterium]|nr:family 16 glycosylhydrolase [Acutalibacteraceae bacterium]
MNIKRIIALILTVFMVASLAACGSTTTHLTAGVNEDGRFIYSIVRSGAAKISAIDDAGKAVRSAIKDNMGITPTIVKDNFVEDFDGNLEILIGDTNREESAIAKQRLIDNRQNNANDFIVAVIGDKICIQVINVETITYAAEWFQKTFCTSMEAFSMLTTDYEFIYEHQYAEGMGVNIVNNVDLGNYTVVLPVKISYLSGMYAEELVDFYDAYGYKLNKVEDMDEEVANEILIGDCDREASKSVTVEGDNYIVKVIGNKVVIKGGNELSTSRGVKAFLDEVKKMSKGQGISWSDGYTVNGKYDATEKGAYTLNWYDEFNSTTIDLTKWGDYNNNSSSTSPSNLGGTQYQIDLYGETEYKGSDLKKLIFQADGDLVLATQRVNNIDFMMPRISTYWTMTYRYGIMEIHGKLAPTPAYSGYWVNGANFKTARHSTDHSRVCMTEIDILENFSRDNQFHSNVHRWWTQVDSEGGSTGSTHNSLDGSAVYSGNSLNNKKKTYDTERYGQVLSDDYHIYSCYWDDSCMKFCFDGKVYLDYQYDENMSVAVHCLMNYFITEVGMGSASYGLSYDKDEHGDYYEHRIDYVRIYQSDLYNCQMITMWPEKQETGTRKVFYPDHPINGAY